MNAPARRKAKKSFTLSTDSIRFLENLRKKRKARSTSSVLDDIVQSFRETQNRLARAKAVTEFYDSLSPEEISEEAAWAEFAQGEFIKQHRSR